MWSALLGRGFRGGLFGLNGPTNSKRFIEASTLLRALRGLVTYISTLPRRASARRRVSALYKTFTVLVVNLASAYSKSLIFFTEYTPSWNLARAAYSENSYYEKCRSSKEKPALFLSSQSATYRRRFYWTMILVVETWFPALIRTMYIPGV